MTQVSRGERSMSPAVQARVEEALDGPARIEPAQPPTVDPRALWDRMDAHELSQNETARLAGISSGHLSQIMNGQRNPSGEMLAKLHGVLFRPTAAELVVPAEVKVMAWKKGGRNGVVVRGAGGPGAGGNQPGGGTVRIGGRVPWGAEVEYAYRAGYDSRGPGVGDSPGGRAGLWPDVDAAGAGRRRSRSRRGPDRGLSPDKEDRRARALRQQSFPLPDTGRRAGGRAGLGQRPPQGTRRGSAVALLRAGFQAGTPPRPGDATARPNHRPCLCSKGRSLPSRHGRRNRQARMAGAHQQWGRNIAAPAMFPAPTAHVCALFAFQVKGISPPVCSPVTRPPPQ